jgi:hypothetical protein
MGILIPRRQLVTLAASAAASSALPLVLTSEADAADAVILAVVVAPNSTLTQISLADLRRVFTSERIMDPDGNPLVPLNHPPKTPDRVGFDRTVLKMSAENVGRFWIDRRIRGAAGPPRTVDNVTMLRRFVAKVAGAIAYVRPAQLSTEVRAIRVEGKLPDEPGYPLRYNPDG